MGQYSIMSELHGGVQTVFWGKSNLFSAPQREMYDCHGLFLFPSTSGLSPAEKEKKEKEHQERMMEQMAMYQRYHDLIWDEEYAPRGSKMTCSYGTKTALLDTMEDHGVYQGSLPVMTCKDCRDQNLHDFGSCMCPERMYRGKVDMTVSMRNGHTAQKAPWNQYPHICVPLINEEEGWHQTIGEVWIKNEEGEAERMLLRTAFLVCLYGGIISFLEVVDVDFKQAEEIDIAPWLHGFRGKPDAQGGTKVTYSSEERNKLAQIRSPLSWYSYEEQTKKNQYCEPYLEGQEFKDGGSGELVDQNGRYWITLGPKVFDPNYSDLGNCNADYFKEQIGCRVDVVLQLMEDEEEYVYIECVWSGNIKAHTFNNGIFQTGHPYPESTEAKKHPYNEDYVDGSIVEFTGHFTGDNGVMSKYRVAYLVVYPKE